MIDNLGREIAGGIDQSQLIAELASSLRNSDMTLTKTGEEVTGIKEGSGKLPQEIADKIKAAFDTDFQKALDYIDTIKKFCEDRSKVKEDKSKKKEPAEKSEKEEKGVIDAVTALGEKLAANMDSRAAGGGFDSMIASGVVMANNYLGQIAGNTLRTATFTGEMAKLFGHKGSGFVHDIHTAAILLDIQKDIRKIGTHQGATFDPRAFEAWGDAFIQEVVAKGSPLAAPTTPAPSGGSLPDPSATANALEDIDITTQDIIGATGNLTKNYEYLNSIARRQARILSMQPHEMGAIVEQMQTQNKLSAEQVEYMNLGLQNIGQATEAQKQQVKSILQQMQATGVTVKNSKQLSNVLEEIGKRAEYWGNTLRDPVQAAMDDIRMMSTQLVRNFMMGATAGVGIQNVMNGIWGAQFEHNKLLHEALFIQQELSAGLDKQRQQYMKLARDASAVAETGVDMLTYQKSFRDNMKLGIKDANTLNRVTRAGLNTAAMTGMNAEQTSKTFAQWNLQLGLSANQMAQVGRQVKFAAQATGLMGDELAQVLSTAKGLADEMMRAATLTAEAAGSFVQISASAKKLGVERSVGTLLKAMSSSVELYNNASDQTQALLFQAASTVGRVGELQTGQVMNTDEGKKDMVKGLENVLNGFLGKFGKNINEIDKLTAQEKFQLNMQLQAAFGMQLGEFKRTIDAYKEGTKTVSDKIKDINEQLKGNLTQQERNALLEQKRQMQLSAVLGDLTKIDEKAKSAKSMGEALSEMKMTESELRAKLSDAVGNVNKALSKAGKKDDMIDPKRIEAALKDPTQYRELLAGINAAEAKAGVAAKAASDPQLAAAQKANELQGKIIENTGKIAEQMASFLGPNGLIAMSLLTLIAIQTQLGQAITSNLINKMMGMFLGGGGGGGVAGPNPAVSQAAAQGVDRVSESMARVPAVGNAAAGGIARVEGEMAKVGGAAATAAGPTSAASKSVAKLATSAASTVPPTQAASGAFKSVGVSAGESVMPLQAAGGGFRGMLAGLLPFIKIILIIGVVLAALIIIGMAVKKALEGMQGEVQAFKDAFGKLWASLKALFGGLISLLAKILTPVVKVLVTALTWLAQALSGVLSTVAGWLGSKPEEAAEKAQPAAEDKEEPAKEAGEAANKQAAAAGPAAATPAPPAPPGPAAKGAPFDVKGLTATDKNLDKAVKSLPDTKKMQSNALSMLGWIALVAAIAVLFGVLAVSFAATAAVVAAAAWSLTISILLFVAALVALIGGLALGVKLIIASMKMFTEAVNEGGLWAATFAWFGAGMNFLLWATAFTVMLAIWSLIGVVVGILALVVGAVAVVVLAAFVIFNLTLALMNLLLVASLYAIIATMNWLSNTVSGLDMWGALGNYTMALFDLLAWTTALGVILNIWAILGLFVAILAAITVSAAAVVLVAFVIFNLTLALMNLLLVASLYAIIATMNWLSNTVSGLDMWGALGNYTMALFDLLAWTTALGVILNIWAILGLFVAILAAITVSAAAVIAVVFAGVLWGIKFIADILRWSLTMAVDAMNFFSETLTELDIWTALGNYNSAIWQLMGWLLAVSATMLLWSFVGIFVLNLAAIGIGVAAFLSMAFAGLMYSLASIAYRLGWAAEACTAAFEYLADAVSELPGTDGIRQSMNTLKNWLIQMMALVNYLDGVAMDMMKTSLFWFMRAGFFVDVFNWFIWIVGNSFNRLDRGSLLDIPKSLDFIEDVKNDVKPDDVLTKMVTLWKWLVDMGRIIAWLDYFTRWVMKYCGMWFFTAGYFVGVFNLFIWVVGKSFNKIDRGTLLDIPKSLEFIDDVKADVDPNKVLQKMIELWNWLVEMGWIIYWLDNFTKWVWKYHRRWFETAGYFVFVFNEFIRVVGGTFLGIDKQKLLDIEKHLQFIDDLPPPMDIYNQMIKLWNWLADMGNIVVFLDSFAKSMRATVRRFGRTGGTFVYTFNSMIWTITSIFNAIDVGPLQSMSNQFKASIVDRLPTPQQILMAYIELGWWMRNMTDIFPMMAQDVKSLERITRKGMSKGVEFAQVFGGLVGWIKWIFDQLSTEALRGAGSNFRGNIVAQLPTPQGVQQTYNEIASWIRRIVAIFPQMSADARALQSATRRDMKKGDEFAAIFGQIAGRVKQVFDAMSTELLRGLGGNWNANVVDRLPTPNMILQTWTDVKAWMQGVAAVFPQMNADMRPLQREVQRNLGGTGGESFGARFAALTGMFRGVFENMNTGLLRGLGGQWNRSVVAQLPTAEQIYDTWNNADTKKGVKAYLRSVAAMFPPMANDLMSFQQEITSQLTRGREFSDTLTYILGLFRQVFSNMNTGLLRGLGGRWNNGVVATLPTADEIFNTWNDPDPSRGVKAYIRSLAAKLPILADDLLTFRQEINFQLARGNEFAQSLQDILGNFRDVFSLMSTGLLRGVGGRWNNRVISRLPTPAQIWDTWENPDPKKGIKAYLRGVAALMPMLADDLRTFRDSIHVEIRRGREFGIELQGIIEGITGMFLLINTNLLRNMGPFMRDVKKGVTAGLPTPMDIAVGLYALEDWLMGVAKTIRDVLPSMVRRLENQISPEIKTTGQESADAIQGMMNAIESIFRKISVQNLGGAFRNLNKKTINKLPTPEDLMMTFDALENWMKKLVDQVLPKLQRLTTDLRASIEGQLNRSLEISRTFGDMVKKIVDIFKNLKVTQLATTVHRFVSSWGRGLPPASELKNIMEQLVTWIQEVFGPDGPMKVLEDAMAGPLSNIDQVADAIREHAAVVGAAIQSITNTFKAMDPTRAIRAIQKLQRFSEGGRAMPNQQQIVAAIENVRQFVNNVSAALGQGGGGVGGHVGQQAGGAATQSAAQGGSAFRPRGGSYSMSMVTVGGVPVMVNGKPVDPNSLDTESLQRVIGVTGVATSMGNPPMIDVAAWQAVLDKRLAQANASNNPSSVSNQSSTAANSSAQQGGTVGSADRGRESALDRLWRFLTGTPMNTEPQTATANTGGTFVPGGQNPMQPVPPNQTQSAMESQIGQRLAGAQAPAGITAANDQLGEIANNTRAIATQTAQTNAILAQIAAALTGGGGSGGSGGQRQSTAANMTPTSTPLFPRLAFNYNGGAQKRYVQTGT